MLRFALLTAAAALVLAPAAHAATEPTIPLADTTQTPITGLPDATEWPRETAVAGDGGVAIAVTNDDEDALDLYAGAVGQPVRKLAACTVKDFEEYEIRVPAVSGGTVAWQKCQKPVAFPTAGAPAVTVFDASGERELPTKDSSFELALAGRTLAIAEDGTLRLIDLDTGAERRLAVPGKGQVARVAGQRDGTVVVTRSAPDSETTSACGAITTSVVRPGGTALTRVPGLDCGREIAVGADRIASVNERGSYRLLVTDLDGGNRRALDAHLSTDPGTVQTDGTTLAWTHNGCQGSLRAAVTLDTLGQDIAERCIVEIDGARLTGNRFSVRVTCPQGCRGLAVGTRGFGTRAGVRGTGSRRVRIRLTPRERATLRRGGRVRITAMSGTLNPALPFRTFRLSL